MSRLKVFSLIFCWVFVCFLGAKAQHQWTSLGEQNWISGIDLAYGARDLTYENTWYRYLIGSDGVEERPFYWRSNDAKWLPDEDPRPSANRVISYNPEEHGNYAFCSAYGIDIYLTTDGGRNWTPKDFPNDQNKHFSTVEVKYHTSNPGEDAYIGSEASGGLGTTYIYHRVPGQLQWDFLGGENEQGDPLFTVNVYDIECDHQGALYAGTSEGIYIKEAGEDFAIPWDWAPSLRGEHIVALEDIAGDGAAARQLAAVTNGNQNSLWFSPNADYFSNPQELRPGDEPFNHAVRDLAGVWWGNGTISSYAATPDGLYLIFFDENSVSTCEAIDLKEVPAAFTGFYPMKSDHNVVAVDYFKENVGDNKKATVLAATPFNLYQIVEVRDLSGQLVGDIEITDAVNGTYPAIAISP